MPDGSARQFTFDLEAKSVITRPSSGGTLAGPGVYELTASPGRAVERSSASRSRRTAARRGPMPSWTRPYCRARIRASGGRGSGTGAKRCSHHAVPTTPGTRSLPSPTHQDPRHDSEYHNNGIQSEGRVGRNDHQWQPRVSASRCSSCASRASGARVLRRRRGAAAFACGYGEPRRSSLRERRRALRGCESARAISHFRPRKHAKARGPRGHRHRRHARRQGSAPRRQHCGGWQGRLHAPLRDVPRPDGKGRAAGGPRGRPGHARDVAAAENHRQLLAVCDHAVGLHPAGDAVRSSGDADDGRDLRDDGVSSLPERDRRRTRRRRSGRRCRRSKCGPATASPPTRGRIPAGSRRRPRNQSTR